MKHVLPRSTLMLAATLFAGDVLAHVANDAHVHGLPGTLAALAGEWDHLLIALVVGGALALLLRRLGKMRRR